MVGGYFFIFSLKNLYTLFGKLLVFYLASYFLNTFSSYVLVVSHINFLWGNLLPKRTLTFHSSIDITGIANSGIFNNTCGIHIIH